MWKEGGEVSEPGGEGDWMDGRVRAPLVGLLAAVQSMPIAASIQALLLHLGRHDPGLTGAEALYLTVIPCYAASSSYH